MEKRLYKSRKERMLFGVCGGIAEYFDVDPTLIRLVTVLAWCSGFGFLAYIIAAIVIPEAPYEG
jgi:phage shock protein C